MNIGELFVSLGFDVDEQKLKDFNDKIISGRNEMLKMTAVAAGATYALSSFLEKSVQNGVAIRNMTNELGANGEAVSKWQTLVRLTNPAMGAEQALESYRKLVDYLRQASLGKGAGALNMLGVNYESGDENNPDKVIKEIRAALPGASGRFDKSQLSGFLAEIFGNSGVLNALNTPQGQADAMVAGKYQTQEQIDQAYKLAQQVAAVGVQWDAFANKMTAQWGPAIIQFLTKFEQKMEKWLPVIGHVIDQIGGIKTIAEVVFGYLTLRWSVGLIVMAANVAKAFGAIGGAVNVATLSAGGALNMLGRLGILGGTAFGGFELGKFLAEKAGLGDTNSQWSKDAGAWLSQKLYPDLYKPRIEHLLGGDQQGNSGTVINQNNSTTQNIHSIADPKDVADHAVEYLMKDRQTNLNGAMIQLNQGPVY